MNKKRTNIYLDDRDKQDLEVIRKHYHLDSDAAAVRFAAHKVAEETKKLIANSQQSGEMSKQEND